MGKGAWLVLSAAIVVLTWPMLSAASGTATGKVAVEGAISLSSRTPAVGDVVYLYLNATPLEDLKALTLRITLPSGLEVAADEATEVAFKDVPSNETVTVAISVRVVEAGMHRIVGEAALFESEDFVESRAFVEVLDCSSQPED